MSRSTLIATADEAGVVIFDEIDVFDPVDADEMDAPSDWDAGSVVFDPYVG